MPDLITITNEWNEQPWFSTGGTRAKKYIQSPDGNFYYFKRSQYKPATENKPGKDFTYEFWNEIIAFELGTMLGFDVLRYDIAIDGDIMGCISQSMINSEEEELIEGVKYLQAFSPNYDPNKKEHQTWYTFDLIKNSLDVSKLSPHIENIIRLILFDALIGNGDRHQENWAIIAKQTPIYKILEEIEQDVSFKKLANWKKWVVKTSKHFFKSTHSSFKKRNQPVPKSHYDIINRFAPIYDSGSSLGRELTDERVIQYINSEVELVRYIDKGLSEIHWEGKKLSHFELVKKIMDTNYREVVVKLVSQIKDGFDEGVLAEMIETIDNSVPEGYIRYKIPVNRKHLIFKIITLRFQKLMKLVNEGV